MKMIFDYFSGSVYTVATALLSPITFLSLILSSLVRGLSLVPMFTLPIFAVGFPRPQSFWKGSWFLRCCSKDQTQKISPVSNSVDWTIYADAAPYLVYEFAKHCEENKTGEFIMKRWKESERSDVFL